MELTDIIIFISLFVGIMFTYTNTALVYFKQTVPAMNMIVMAAGWTIFIYLVWL